ncbi:MAG TPA: hypothetical protein VF979_02450 [Streptosporangiaceae bacterium]
MTQFPEMDDPELQQLMDLDAAERGESEFVPTNFGGAGLDPELQQLMDLDATERGEAEFVPTHPGGAALDPELAQLMALEEAERTGQPIPPPDGKGRRWRRGR